MQPTPRKARWLLAAGALCIAISTPPARADDNLVELLIHAPPNRQGMVTREAYLKQAGETYDAMKKQKKANAAAGSTANDRSLENLLTHAGADKDGTVSRETFMKHMRERWDKADRARRGAMAEESYRKFVDELAGP